MPHVLMHEWLHQDCTNCLYVLICINPLSCPNKLDFLMLPAGVGL